MLKRLTYIDNYSENNGDTNNDVDVGNNDKGCGGVGDDEGMVVVMMKVMVTVKIKDEDSES